MLNSGMSFKMTSKPMASPFISVCCAFLLSLGLSGCGGEETTDPDPFDEGGSEPSDQTDNVQVITLENGEEVLGLNASKNTYLYFVINVEDGASNLRFTTSGGTGDSDMYVRFGELANETDFDCFPYARGSEEFCVFNEPQQGAYYVSLYAYEDFENLRLLASYDGAKDDLVPIPTQAPDSSDTPNNGDIIGDCQLSEVEQDLFAAHNQARSEARFCGGVSYPAVPALKWNCKLGTAARLHSDDMSNNSFMDHTGSDGSRPYQRAQAQGYDSRYIGENVGAGYSSVERAMQGWLTSDGHCGNIMNADYAEMGAAYTPAVNGNDRFSGYWTAMFGRVF